MMKKEERKKRFVLQVMLTERRGEERERDERPTVRLDETTVEGARMERKIHVHLRYLAKPSNWQPGLGTWEVVYLVDLADPAGTLN